MTQTTEIAALIEPDQDGITHINVYSNGRTHLGRWLSNFAYERFTHPVHGEFASLEGYWFWNATGRIHENLRALYGASARKVGMTLPRMEMDATEFHMAIYEGFLQKALRNPLMALALKGNRLPLRHYFAYFSKDPEVPAKVIDYSGKHAWQLEFWTQLGEFLRRTTENPEIVNHACIHQVGQSRWQDHYIACRLPPGLESMVDAVAGVVMHEMLRQERQSV